MRMIFLLLLASIFGYGLLQIDKIDANNYVKIYLGNYVVEIKVLGFILLLIAVVLVLYALIRFIHFLLRSPKIFSNWRGRVNHDQAELQLGAGYLSLIKGDWGKAEKLLLNKTKHSAVPYVNYLAAAQAAQEMGKLDKRDDYLQAAYDAAPKERLAIGLTKAKLHQQAGQIELALATLSDMQDEGKNNPQFTAMLLQTYEQQQNWGKAKELLPIAKKQNVFAEKDYINTLNNIYVKSFSQSEDILSAWHELPKDQKKNLSNIEIYARHLVSQGETSEAEKLIRSSLKNTWSDELVKIYGMLKADKPAKLLRTAEGWLMARPENAQLNLTAGRLALASKKHDAAKEYLQAAISLDQLPEAYAVLGEVYESMNDSGQALKSYRLGMQALSTPSKALALKSDIYAPPEMIVEGAHEGELIPSDKKKV